MCAQIAREMAAACEEGGDGVGRGLCDRATVLAAVGSGVGMRSCRVSRLVCPGRVRGAVTVLAAAVLLVFPGMAAGDVVVWDNVGADSIASAALDGSRGSTLTLAGVTINAPQGVALDPASGRIYWANLSPGSISWAQLDGSGGGTLRTTGASISEPVGVAVDPATGTIYWVNERADSIAWAKLDGSGGGTLKTTAATVNDPTGVAVDPATGTIYWANYASNSIAWAKLDGSGGGTLNTAAATIDGPAGVAVDPATGTIYWANYASNSISWARLDGSGGGTLTTTGATISAPVGVAVDLATGTIYWTDEFDNSISWANLDGSGGGTLTTTGATVSTPYYLAVLAAPRGAGAPVLSGGSAVGSSLSCSQGTWAGDVPSAFFYQSPTSISYQWTLGGLDISGATAMSYIAITPGAYACRVTASNEAGSASQTSAPFTVVAAPPANTAVPSLAGRLTVGQVLSAVPGDWTGTTPLTYAYQWQRCTPACSDIAAAISSSYRLAAADLGARLRVLVTATNSLGRGQATSQMAGPIFPNAAQIGALLLGELTPAGRAATLPRVLAHAGYTGSYRTLSSGRLTIDWYDVPKGATFTRARAPKPVLIATGSTRFTTATIIKLTIKLTAAGKHTIKSSTRLTLTAKGTYAPTGRPAVTTTRTFTLSR